MTPDKRVKADSLNSTSNLLKIHQDGLINLFNEREIEPTDLPDYYDAGVWLALNTYPATHVATVSQSVDGNNIGEKGSINNGITETFTKEEMSSYMIDGDTFQVGYTTAFSGVSTGPSRRAEQITIPSEGMLQSISIYHNGGSGGLILAVYSDNLDKPDTLLGVTQIATVNNTEGWQELALVDPAPVFAGQKVWLAWLTETAVSLRWGSGGLGRIDSGKPWSAGMPTDFGNGTSTSAVYSLYATVIEGPVPNLLPVASFTSDLNGYYAVSFDATSSSDPDGTIASWEWDFGDGQIGSGETITHTYPPVTSTYTVTLTVTDDDGTPESFSLDVTPSDMSGGQAIQVGYNTAFTGVSTGPSRRAEQIIISNDGMMRSISIYHNGGSGGLLLAVYSDNAGIPGTRLGVTPIAALNSTEGWQELALIYPVSVLAGQKVWLSWLTETAVGLRYGYDSPGRIDSGSPWSGGMPMVFGTGTSTGAVYSLYATVIEGPVLKYPNLVAHWELDNSPADASGNNIHGELNGNPEFVQSAIVGSHAIELNGVDQYIDFGNPTQMPSGRSPRTMSAWMKTNDVSYDYRFAVAYGKAAVRSAMFIGQRGTELIGGSNADGLAVNDFWEIGTWHHVVLSYDGDTARLYGDGIKLASSYKNWSLILDKAYLGLSVTDIKYWNGAIDDVRIYDKALTDAEVLDLYNQDANNYLAPPTNLVINQTTDQKVELIWHDNSENEGGFIIERKANAGSYVILDSLPSNTTSYLDTTVLLYNDYIYRLYAFNSLRNSDFSEQDTIYLSPITRVEIEDNYQVLNDVGSYGTVGVTNVTINSNGKAVRLYDDQDEIAVSFDIPEAGTYDISVWLRCGDSGGAQRYWPGGYIFSLSDHGQIDFVGNSSSVIGPYSEYGTSFWGMMEVKDILFNSPGAKSLQIKADGNWRVVDYINIIYKDTVLVSAPPTNLEINQIADQKVELTWQDNSNNEAGFIIERSENGGVFSHLDSLGVDASSYQDSTVVTGNYYQYRLFAFNTLLNSDSIVTDSLKIITYQPNLVAHWELDNNADDASGNNINGVLNGNPQYTNSAVVGSHAIELNGVDQYIDFGNPTQLPSGRSPRTMSAWMKTNDISYDYRFAVAYGKAAVRSAMFIGQRGTELIGGSNADGLAVNDFWEIGTWHHIVLSYDGDTARLYGDGIKLTSSYKDWPLILDKVYLGRSVTDIIYWNGAVDDVRIYDKALSDAEVLDLYNKDANNYLAAPTNLLISQIADQKVEITWQDNSDNEDGFVVERSENGGVFSHLDSLGVDASSYQDSTVVTGNYYQYRLFAFNTYVNSDTLITDSLNLLNQPNLVAYWELDNSPDDASGNNITGVLNGNPEFVTSAIVGSHAIELNGVDQYIDFGNPTQLPSGKSPRTISAWIKTNTTTDDWRFAVAYGQATTAKAMFIGLKGTTLYGGAYADAITVTDFWSIGVWHHVVFSYDGDTARLYTDGVEKISMYKNWSLILDRAYIGRQINNDEYWNGAIDDVRIYDKVLSDAEILDLYNQDANNFLAPPTNLVLNQTADQKVELTWQDNSNNEAGFIIERSENGGVFSHLDSLGVDASSYQDSTVVTGNYYQYRLFAFNTLLNSDSIVTDSLKIITYQPNLVAYWELDNNADDASGNNINGVLNGNPQYTNSAVVGSHAIELNGVDQYIDFGNPTQLPSGRSPRTMSAWMKTNDISYDYRFAVAYGKAAVRSAMFIGQRGTELIGGSNADGLAVNDFWEIGTWHHIVLSYDGDTARLYGDGIKLTSSYKNWSLILDKAYVGRSVTDIIYWNGAVDDVRIYDKALTDAEVLDLYHQNASSPPSAPTNLVINQIADQEVEITWQDNSENEDGFILERKMAEDSLFTVLGNVSVDSTIYIDTTVTGDTSYDYRIQAYNSTDSSEYSSVASIFVHTVTTLQPPTEFKLLEVTGAQAKFMWTDNSSEELGFIIQRKDGMNGFFQTTDSLDSNTSFYTDASILEDTIYSYRIAAYGAFGLSDFSEVITFQAYDQGMVLDSIEYAALESFFNALDGENWYCNDNWLSGYRYDDFATWCGLIVEDGDVIGIDLSYNNLSGEIPEEFCQLAGLRGNAYFEGNHLTGSHPVNYGNLGGSYNMPPNLYLTDNNLTQLREVQGINHVLYNQLWIEYNKIEFSQLEQYASQWHAVIYNPQKEIGEPDTVEVLYGTEFQLGSGIGGENTSWQWQMLVDDVWQDISGAIDSALVIPDFNSSNEGIFRCVASNTQFSDLTLYTATTILVKNEFLADYDQVLYVSMSGVDSLAQSNNSNEPWATPHLASVEAHTRFQSDSLKYLVYVQKGTYHDYWVTMPGIDIYFEDDAVVWYNTDTQSSRSIISDWRGGAGDYKVLGKGRFYVSTVSGADDRDAINFRYNSTLQIECKEFNSLQFWDQFQSPVEFNDVVIRLPQNWYSAINADITYNNCEFKTGYLKITVGGRGSHEIFNNCTFHLPAVASIDELLNVTDHLGESIFSMKIPQIDLKLNTAALSTQEIADLPYINYNDVINSAACFDVHGPQNPWGGWSNKSIDFTFTLNNPTFLVDRPNGIATRAIWNENDSIIDYASAGIKINNGQAVTGPNGTNPVFIQADKRDSVAVDIPIVLYNNTYTGFTERVQRTGYYPMQLNTVDEGNVPDALELQALIAIYESLGGVNWTDNSGWLEGVSNQDFDQWKGISVGNGDVYSIDLNYNNLSGSVPPEIGDLQGLQLLRMHSNDIFSLPGELFSLPEIIDIGLSNNKIAELPSAIGELENLNYVQMDVSNNLLEVLPFEIIYPWDMMILWAENNYLDFENLCTFYGQPDTNDYNHFLSPQRSRFSETVQVTLQDNTLLDAVRVNAYGSNLYQWQEYNGTTWQDIPGETSQTMNISASNNDYGMYRCEVTNTTITKLTLYGPVYHAVAYVAAVADGNWNDPATWTGLPAGTYPNRNHIISISGHAVTVNGDFETGDIVLDNAAQGTALNISGGLLQVYGTVKVLNVNPDHTDCKLEVTGSGKISVLNSNQ